jgi:hypothetical protein
MAMPNPIRSATDSSAYAPAEAASADENNAQMCLPSAIPSANASSTSSALPPAVNALVSRFVAPSGTHAPVQPSLPKALWDCSVELSNAAASVSALVVSGPAGLAAALITGVHTFAALVSAERCVERDESQQVTSGTQED